MTRGHYAKSNKLDKESIESTWLNLHVETKNQNKTETDS